MFLYRQTNTDFKISQYVCAQIKIMPIKCRILYPTNSRVLYPLNAFFAKKKSGLLFRCKQTFSKFSGKITRVFLRLRMQNFQGIVFI